MSRAIEVQPCFNQDELSQLSDQATTNRLEIEAWAEGESIQFDTSAVSHILAGQVAGSEDSETDNELLYAAVSGNLDGLRGWISRLGSAPEAGPKLTRTFLSAVGEAPIAALQLLVTSNVVDLLAQDEINGRNCLHEAAIAGREDVLMMGIQAGVDVSTKDVYGRMPLHYACMHGQVAMITQLLQQNLDTINDPDHDRFTPLVQGIVHRQLECVHQLLQSGAQIEPQSDNDHIPLNLACQYGAQEIVQMLLERDARVLPDADGLFPQHLVARSHEHADILLLLESHGADLDQRDKLYQWTPLFHAASEGCTSTLKILLDKGVEVDVEDEKGLPAMYYAAWEGHLECVQLLDQAAHRKPQSTTPEIKRLGPQDPGSSMPSAMSIEHDGIPDLELPPPIIPLRRYGHNFLDSKAFIQISFDPAPLEGGFDAILFYHDNKYPAARLTISSKSSDLIPRNVALPLQEEDSRRMSFQVEHLEAFTLEFDIYPTFGARRIAHGVALPDIFTAEGSSKGRCVVPLFDPRLRVIGRIAFQFQVLKPCSFPGAPIELTGAGPMETYWKAMTQDTHQPDSLVIGSSLSGEYLQLFVQLTADCVPVLYPRWGISGSHPKNVPVGRLTLTEFQALGPRGAAEQLAKAVGTASHTLDMGALHKLLAEGHFTLADALEQLPQSVNVVLNVLYPSSEIEQRLGFGKALNINDFADAVLCVVFDHARRTKGSDTSGFVRSIAFASWNADICTALNWKQPNYPVLLCNNSGTDVIGSDANTMPATSAPDNSITGPAVDNDGRVSISVKEAVRIAQSNNFMGLVCSSKLLVSGPSRAPKAEDQANISQNSVPALSHTIKVAGLVLVSDTSFDADYARSRSFAMPSGVDGLLKANGVMRFNNTVDM